MIRVIVFFIVTTFLFSDSVDNLKDRMRKIESEIKQKNSRIQSIDFEKINIQKQIDRINKDIKNRENKSLMYQNEIKTVNKSIDYGQRNLGVSDRVLDRKKSEYKAKMIAVARKYNLTSNTKEKSIAKRSFSRLLYADLESMEHIKKIHNSIEVVKQKIERDKKRLTVLKRKLDLNIQAIESKKQQKNYLIAKLNSEKRGHVKTISKLQMQKRKIAKEIERIIKSRTVTTKKIKLDSAVLKLGKFVRPIAGKTVVRFKQKKAGQVISNGIEIAGNMGQKVKATTFGTVIYADKFQGLNNVVMIDYGYNTIGVYGNLIAVGVKLKQKVKKGENIGVLGLNTDGQPYLYYEVRFNLKPIDPETLF